MIPPPDSGLTLMFLWLLCYVPHFLRAYYVTLNLRKLKKEGKNVPGGYDLRSPRVCVNQATDDSERGKLIGRLGGAHNNLLENFAFIACAVVIAKQSGISSALIDARAAYYAASRVLYLCFYTVSSTPALGLARALVFVAGGVIMGDLYLRAARVY